MGKTAGMTGRGATLGAAVLAVVAALVIAHSWASAPRGTPSSAPMQVRPIQTTPTKEPNVPTPPEKPNHAEVASSPFTLTATIARSVPEGQPVILALDLSNTGTESLAIGGSAFEASAFQLTVLDGAGRTVPRTALGERTLTPPTAVFANAIVMINPGQTLQYRFNLARLFDLSRAGNYVVSVRRILASESFSLSAPKHGVMKPPKKTTLTIVPLKFRMTEDEAAASGPTPQTSLPSRQTFLYMASKYQSGVSRYRVSEDGSVSFAFSPKSPDAEVSIPKHSLGEGPDALAATPDGRFLYTGNPGDNTVSQYRIGDDGVLSPLSPPKVPAQKFPGLLLMDPQGRFLYALSNWGNTLYAIGADGRLTVTALMPSEAWEKERDHNVVPSDFGVIDSTGTFLYACNGLPSGYRLASNGRVTALPTLSSAAMEPNSGRANAIALSPTGKFAFVGVSKENGGAFFDSVVPMRISQDGVLTPIPRGARTPPTPSYPKGFQPYQCSTLVVDPTGRFLVVVNPGFLDCYRIEADGPLTLLGMTEQKGRLDSIFFVPGSPLAYVHNSNPASLLAFRLDDQHGLLPAEINLPNGVPFDACIASAVAPTPQRWGPRMGGLEMSARLPADVQPADAPVTLTVTLRNVTTHPIRLGTAGTDMTSFRLSLSGPQRQSPGVLQGGGEPATTNAPLLAAGHDLLEVPGTDGAMLILPPGAERQYRFVLSRLADMTVAGNYTLQISRKLPDGMAVAAPVMHVLLEGPFNGITRSGNGSLLEVF